MEQTFAVVLPLLLFAFGFSQMVWAQQPSVLFPRESYSHGDYEAGALFWPRELSADGPGFVHLFHFRGRYFGSTLLVSLLERAALFLSEESPPDSERLQIGDLSSFYGGRIRGHQSHQNGLDADIVYLRHNHREQDLLYARGFREEFVRRGRLSSNFDVERNRALIRFFIATDYVRNIFVDPVILNALIQGHEEETWVGFLKPYPRHADHMHLRLIRPEFP